MFLIAAIFLAFAAYAHCVSVLDGTGVGGAASFDINVCIKACVNGLSQCLDGTCTDVCNAQGILNSLLGCQGTCSKLLSDALSLSCNKLCVGLQSQFPISG